MSVLLRIVASVAIVCISAYAAPLQWPLVGVAFLALFCVLAFNILWTLVDLAVSGHSSPSRIPRHEHEFHEHEMLAHGREIGEAYAENQPEDEYQEEEEETQEMRVGDVVQLLSGGPEMTILRFTSTDKDTAECGYFTEAEQFVTVTLPVAVIEEV